MQDVELLTRRIERERQARVAAESILEEKSLEVFETNQKLTRVAGDLRAEMEKSQAVLEHAAEGIITIDQDGSIQSFNPAAEEIFGLRWAQALGHEFALLFSDASKICCREIMDRKGFGPEELIGLKSDGTEFVMELTISLVETAEETTLIALVRDRTKRKQLEAQLSLAQKMESVGQLAAGIAHEINTPIQFVGDNVRFLADAFEDINSLMAVYDRLSQVRQRLTPEDKIFDEIHAKRVEADLEFIREEIPKAIEQSKTGIQRVATIVQAMKEFSHPGATESTTVDINASLESTITVSRNEWRYVAELETDFEDNLPAVLGYPGDLNQAFLNIIVNAAHAIEQQGVASDLGKITVATKSQGDWIEVRISDSGCGIPEDKKRKIFDPFFTTKAVGKGTGQGLSIVHQVITDKHLGKIDVESVPGNGTTFIISLPIDPESSN